MNWTKMKMMPKQVFAELPQTYELSPEQRQFYADNGYLVIKELIDFASLYTYKQHFIRICNGLVPKMCTVVKEPRLIDTGVQGEALVNKVQDILYDEVFQTYTENPRLLHVVSQLIGNNITGVHSMMINKPPGTGEHPPHQDMYYFPFRPMECVVGTWTAIDHVYLDNGCLFAFPGSHKPSVLYEHAPPPGASKLYHGVREPAVISGPRVHLEMSPGDTVLLHPLLVHGSGPNVTENYRKCISCHYANSELCRYIDVAGTQQQALAKEVADLGNKWGFDKLSYQDVFRFKSKAVKGPRCNL